MVNPLWSLALDPQSFDPCIASVPRYSLAQGWPRATVHYIVSAVRTCRTWRWFGREREREKRDRPRLKLAQGLRHVDEAGSEMSIIREHLLPCRLHMSPLVRLGSVRGTTHVHSYLYSDFGPTEVSMSNLTMTLVRGTDIAQGVTQVASTSLTALTALTAPPHRHPCLIVDAGKTIGKCKLAWLVFNPEFEQKDKNTILYSC